MGKYFTKISSYKTNYFIGIAPPTYIKEQIPSNRSKGDLHVTLSYLGGRRTKDEKLIAKEIAKTLKQVKNFELSGPFIASFKGKYPHIGIEKNTRLMKLIDLLSENPVLKSQLNKKYSPHITLGKQDITNSFLQNSRYSFPVEEVTLFKVQPRGKKVYTSVQSFPLNRRNWIDKVIDYFQYT